MTAILRTPQLAYLSWADSKATFARNLRTSSGGQLLQVLTQLENISGENTGGAGSRVRA